MPLHATCFGCARIAVTEIARCLEHLARVAVPHRALIQQIIEYAMRLGPVVAEPVIPDWVTRINEDFQAAIKEATKDHPYLATIRNEVVLTYNPQYGDYRVCQCTHVYVKHFDTYEEMAVVGCKYCDCETFTERKEE